MKFNKVVKSFALTAGLLASFTSSADTIPFEIDESVYSNGNSSVIGEKFNGSYQEELVFNGTGFQTGAFASFTSVVGASGPNYDSVIGVKTQGLGYALYAVLTAGGTSNAAQTSFSADWAQFSLYIDPSFDTTSTDLLNGGVNDASSDDILIGSATMVENAYGNYENSTGNFNFDFTDFTLTSFGEAFFVTSSPFVTVNGDFDTLDDLPSVEGDLSASFSSVVSVPEPSTVAVLALGLMGLGVSARRKNK